VGRRVRTSVAPVLYCASDIYVYLSLIPEVGIWISISKNIMLYVTLFKYYNACSSHGFYEAHKCCILGGEVHCGLKRQDKCGNSLVLCLRYLCLFVTHTSDDFVTQPQEGCIMCNPFRVQQLGAQSKPMVCHIVNTNTKTRTLDCFEFTFPSNYKGEGEFQLNH